MRYSEFRTLIEHELGEKPGGLTWLELRETLSLPYRQPCPEWVKQLETDIGLERRKKRGNAYLWQLKCKELK